MAEPETDLSLEEAIGADIDAALNGGAKAVEDVESDIKEYVRDGRRFVPKEKPGKDATAETAEPDPAEPAVASPEQAAPAKQEWRPLWYKDEYGEWSKLPEPLRKTLQEREREYSQGIEKHAVAAKAWEPLAKTLEPHKQVIEAQYGNAQEYLTQLHKADVFLRQNPVEAMNWLAQQYLGTDIYGLAQWMQEQQYQPQRVDPMQQELEKLRRQVEELREAPVRQQREAMMQELQAWSKDKPYFEELRSYMAALARTPEYQGATYDQLYEAAQYAHPTIRERILTDQRKREVAEARARGAQSPRGTPDEGAAPRKAKRQSVEADVKAAFDEAGL